jgi:hypothetical protein
VSALQIRKPDALAEPTAAMRELTAEIRALRADPRRHSPAAVPALVGALEEHYGPARFTVRSVLEVVDESRHSALTEAIARLIDMNASPRSSATALGTLLSRLPEVEVIAERPGIYRLRRVMA